MLTAESELQVRQGNLYNPSHYFIRIFNIRRALEYMPISNSYRLVPFIAGGNLCSFVYRRIMVQFDKEIMPCSDHSSKRQLITSNNASRNTTTFWTTIVVSGFSCPLKLVNCRRKEHEGQYYKNITVWLKKWRRL